MDARRTERCALLFAHTFLIVDITLFSFKSTLRDILKTRIVHLIGGQGGLTVGGW